MASSRILGDGLQVLEKQPSQLGHVSAHVTDTDRAPEDKRLATSQFFLGQSSRSWSSEGRRPQHDPPEGRRSLRRPFDAFVALQAPRYSPKRRPQMSPSVISTTVDGWGLREDQEPPLRRELGWFRGRLVPLLLYSPQLPQRAGGLNSRRPALAASCALYSGRQSTNLLPCLSRSSHDRTATLLEKGVQEFHVHRRVSYWLLSISQF